MGIETRAVLALAAMLAFLVLCIGVRAFQQWRRTGASGIVLSRFGTDRNEQIVLAFLPVSVALVLIAIAAGLAGSTLGGPDAVSPAIALGGFVLAVTAVAGSYWSQLAMGASWRIGQDKREELALVTNGPYRVVRNPIYTSMLAAVLGCLLMLPSPVTALAVMTTFTGIEIVVRAVEEPFLRRRHGDAYATWAHSAGRFLPGVGRL
jgi:protein-S-isoprenylcysteine O-methyltransferase Ste14